MDTSIILFDWLTFTLTDCDFDFIIDMMGLPALPWKEKSGRYYYRQAYWFDGINIYVDGTLKDRDMGICVEMSGGGCRTYEKFSNKTVKQLIIDLKNYDAACQTYDEHKNPVPRQVLNFTRIDLALDLYLYQLDLTELITDIHAGNYVSRCKTSSIQIEEHAGHIGQTIYIGSNKSEIRFRIYDKKFEQGKEDIPYWVRFEVQLRQGRANNYADHLAFSDITSGETFVAIVNNYFRVVVPSEAINKRELPTAGYWQYLMDQTIDKVSLYSSKTPEYNIGRVKKYVYKQAGNSIEAIINTVGVLQFLKELKNNKPEYTEKYQQIHTQTEKIKKYLERHKNDFDFDFDEFEEL